jgi:hypothetical protein
VEVFKLLGKIAVENTDAINAINETATEAENTSGKLKTSFEKFGQYALEAGKVIATGLGVATTAMGKLLKDSLDLSGEVEQGFGGAEAVFAKYAEKIKTAAKSAYASMGLSVSDYLATANKMGSLFIGTGAEIENAYDMTTNAMQRAADVAAIMGIDIEWAMESVAGMAKGNFTMMDNLGVAMNETTLQAYALEKGIETSIEKMTLGEKVGLAYAMFMDRTAYAMGQYTKENDTYAGSINTAKAAWENLLSGQIDAEEAIPHFENAADVIIKRIESLMPVLVTAINKLMDAISPNLPGFLEALLPGLIEGATQLLTGLIRNIPAILKSLAGELPGIIASITQALGGLFGVGSTQAEVTQNAIDNYVQGLTGKKTTPKMDSAEYEKTRKALGLKTGWGAFKQALGFGGDEPAIKMPDAKATAAEIKAWFDSLDPELKKELGLEMPGPDATARDIEAWWADVRPTLTATFSVVPDNGTFTHEGTTFGGSGGSFGVDGSHVPGFASGLDYVPKDNYLARLHLGETVLNKEAAAAWRQQQKGGGTAHLEGVVAELASAIQDLREGIGMNLYVNKRHVASAMSRDMGRSIGNREYTLMKGMGG